MVSTVIVRSDVFYKPFKPFKPILQAFTDEWVVLHNDEMSVNFAQWWNHNVGYNVSNIFNKFLEITKTFKSFQFSYSKYIALFILRYNNIFVAFVVCVWRSFLCSVAFSDTSGNVSDDCIILGEVISMGSTFIYIYLCALAFKHKYIVLNLIFSYIFIIGNNVFKPASLFLWCMVSQWEEHLFSGWGWNLYPLALSEKQCSHKTCFLLSC